ncbi:MAG: hypothetical protein ACI841_003827 [Planctomycetota bacterium]|jgi:hypothetical protein
MSKPLSVDARLRLASALVMCTLASPAAPAQVHAYPDGRPWAQRAGSGPDAEVSGWFYNLGITGMRVTLDETAPRELLVKHVFKGSPADGKVRVGDTIIGTGGRLFESDYRNGYGMDVFGPTGPVLEFAQALEVTQTKAGKGMLPLVLMRAGKRIEARVKLGTKHGQFEASYPAQCEKSEDLLEGALDYLVDHQRSDGSWGSTVQDTFAPLALLASGKKKYRKSVERNVRWHARTTHAVDESGLINWRYMAAAIVMSEYYLATRARWVMEELQEVYDFLYSSQYMDLSQVNPRSKESHPGSYPEGPMDAHGGWGHNPGFEGYGPICMLTGQGALAFALMSHCGIKIDRQRHEAAYAFLERATGRNAYVWYADEAAGHNNWADMGRTGATGIANWLSPWDGEEFRRRAEDHAKVIGLHPESFPDTHASPLMGMGYAAVAASVVDGSFRNLMNENRWWFLLSECDDGSFYYQPNRDNSGYGADSRIAATAIVAFIFTIPNRSLRMTQRRDKK